MNYHTSLCSSSTLISAGLFVEMKRKKIRERGTDRNPFVSLCCDYLHGDEGPECSAVFRCEYQTIEPVFVLSREVWEGQKKGREDEEKGRSSTEGITHCEKHTHLRLPLWRLNCSPVPGYLVKQIVFLYTPRWSLLTTVGDKWLGGQQQSHKQVGVVVVDAICIL